MASNEYIVQKEIIEKTASSIHQIEKGDFEALKQAAKVYLDQIGMLSDFYRTTIMKKRIVEKIKDIYSNMRINEKYTQLMLQYQHEFEISLNSFLGRTIYLVYVNNDGTLNYYDDANIGKLYAQATANKGRGNISKEKIFDANDLQENIKKLLIESANNKKLVYVSALERYYKTSASEQTYNYDPSKNTFYWRLNDAHHITGYTRPFSNTGPIAEGYAEAVINNDEKPNISNDDIENSLKILYENYIDKDSIGAAIKGDIVFGSDNSIQFAVKKGSFSTAMVGQYMRLAINIQQLEQISIDDFEKALPYLIKINKLSNQIIEVFNNQTTEEIKKEIRSKLNIQVQ